MTSYKPPARARPRLILLALVVVAALGWGTHATAQETPTTTAPGAPPELLVPGDTTPATTAAPTQESVPTVTVPEAGDDSGDGGLDASTKVWLIVIGLVLVAAVTAVLTVLYWRHTRPSRAIAEKPERTKPRWWARVTERSIAEQPDPTTPMPRPGHEGSLAEPSPAPEPAAEPPAEPLVGDEPEEPEHPARPAPDYWSGV